MKYKPIPVARVLLALLLALSVAAPLSAQVLDNGGLTLVGPLNHCADAGSTDAYACALAPAISAYQVGTCYSFSAATANTGAATLSLNGLTATAITKMAGAISTPLIDNDIRAGQLVRVCYDGTRFQMQSQLGTAGTGTVTATAGALTLNQLVLGAGTNDTKALGTLGTTTTLLHGSAAGLPTFAAVDLAVDVTGNLATSHLNSGTLASASTFWRGDGTWATPAGSGTVTATAGALTLNALVLGAAGTDTKVLASLGTTTTLLHGNASGAPTFAAVNLATEVTGNLSVNNLNSGTSASSSTFWRGDGTWQTPAGAGNVSNTGTPTAGQLALWTAATVLQGVTALPAANFPALTGDVTTSAASLTTTLTNIPTGTTAAGFILGSNMAAPSTPAAGKVAVYTDTTDLRLHDKNASGIIGTTVVADAGATNQFLTAISAAGVVSKAQPAFTNLTGSATAAQMPAYTGDVTSPAGSSVNTLANIPTATPAAGTILHTNITAPGLPGSGKVFVWSDTTDNRLHEKNNAGTIGTTVVADAGASNNFLTAISAAGVISKAQPAFSNLSGTALAAQLPTTTVNSVTNDTNVTGSITAQALTLGWTGTLAKARIIGTAVYNDQNNTWTTGTQDLGSATALVVPKAAGAAPTADGDLRYDTTRKTPVWGSNGVATLAGVGLLCSGFGGSTNDATSGAGSDVNHTPTCTIPGNFLQSGKRLRACVMGTFTSTATGTPTIAFTLKTGSTVLATGSANNLNNGRTASTNHFCYRLTAEAAPSGGSAVRVAPEAIPDAICCGDNINRTSQPIPLASTGNLVLTLASQFGTNVAGNTWTLSDFTVEALN